MSRQKFGIHSLRAKVERDLDASGRELFNFYNLGILSLLRPSGIANSLVEITTAGWENVHIQRTALPVRTDKP